MSLVRRRRARLLAASTPGHSKATIGNTAPACVLLRFWCGSCLHACLVIIAVTPCHKPIHHSHLLHAIYRHRRCHHTAVPVACSIPCTPPLRRHVTVTVAPPSRPSTAHPASRPVRRAPLPSAAAASHPRQSVSQCTPARRQWFPPFPPRRFRLRLHGCWLTSTHTRTRGPPRPALAAPPRSPLLVFILPTHSTTRPTRTVK